MAIMGGIATSVFGRPRTTYDVDGFILIEPAKAEKVMEKFKAAGFNFYKKHPIKTISGMRFITLLYSKLKTYVDLFIAETEFQQGIIGRAEKVRLGKTLIPIVSPEDLILLKLKSGRAKDVEDVREILMENKNRLDYSYLKHHAKELRVDLFLKDELESLRIS